MFCFPDLSEAPRGFRGSVPPAVAARSAPGAVAVLWSGFLRSVRVIALLRSGAPERLFWFLYHHVMS